MFRPEIEAGFVGKVLELLLFFVVDETAIEAYLVSFCSGEGEKIRPSKPAWSCLGEQTYCVEDVVFSFIGEANNDKNGAVDTGVINKTYGFNNGLISHIAIENIFADFIAAGLDAEFYDFAVGGFEVRCERAVEKAEMRIYDKGKVAGLLIQV